MDRPRALAFVLMLVAASLAMPTPVAASGATTLVITEIVANPADGEREFIELHNAGNATVDLANWTIEDAAGNSYTFAARNLSAGEYVVLWGGGSADALGPAWSMASAWNNGGDTAKLLRPDGSEADNITYGSGGIAVPAKGKAVSLLDGSWQELDPSPGAAPDAGGGTVSATVLDVAPVPTIHDAPTHARTGTAFTVHIEVREPNGDAVTWSLLGGAASLETGNATGHANLTITAPLVARAWTLTLRAEDAGGNIAETTRLVDVRAGDLVVDVPATGVPFPSFSPGATDVDATEVFTLKSLANATFTPRFDMSPFRAGASEIPVDDHVRIGTRAAGSNDTWVWTEYTGPLTPLPSIAPGDEVEVLLRLTDVPAVLAAGAYGTSFTVIR